MAPRPRFANLDPAVKARLFQAASEEFAQRGFEQASYNRILAAAGLSKGSAYYYFDDKEDLYATVVGQALTIAISAIGLVAPTRNPDEFWRELAALHQRSLLFLREQPTAAALARSLVTAPRSILERGALGDAIGQFTSWMSSFLVHGQSLGAVRKDLPIDLLAAAVNGLGEAYDRWTLAHWDEAAGSQAALDRTVARAVDLIRRMVAPPERKPSTKEKTARRRKR